MEEAPELQLNKEEDKGDHVGAGPPPGDTATIKKFLSIESRISEHDEGDLRKILLLANKQGVKSDGDLALWLKKVAVKLGTPGIGQTRVKQMLNFLDLEDQIDELLKQQQAYMR